jgi:hypothetical protein
MRIGIYWKGREMNRAALFVGVGLLLIAAVLVLVGL